MLHHYGCEPWELGVATGPDFAAERDSGEESASRRIRRRFVRAAVQEGLPLLLLLRGGGAWEVELGEERRGFRQRRGGGGGGGGGRRRWGVRGLGDGNAAESEGVRGEEGAREEGRGVAESRWRGRRGGRNRGRKEDESQERARKGSFFLFNSHNFFGFLI